MGSIRQSPSGKFEARYRDPHGRLRGKTFRRKSDERRFLVAVEADKQRGTWTDPRSGRITVRDFAMAWLETTVHLKPSTRKSYEMLLRRYVIPNFGGLRLASIQRIQVQAWLSEMVGAGVGAGTVRNAYRVLSAILAEAERSRVITANPAKKIPLPKSRAQDMHFLLPEEIGRLADAMHPRFKALILTAGFTGLRWGKLAALRVEHLDLLRGTIDVRESVTEVGGRLERIATKSGERRTVPIARFLTEVLGEHIKQFLGAEGSVFTSPEGGPLRHQNFYRRHFKPALRQAGLDPGVRFHDLRP
jgi:integrase